MRKVFLFIMVVLLMLTLVSCSGGNSFDENAGFDSDYYEGDNNENVDNYEDDTFYDVDASELGFDYLDYLGNNFVCIEAYSVNSGYVETKGTQIRGFLFEDGWLKRTYSNVRDLDPEEIDINLDSGKSEYSYEVIDNDTVSLQNGWTGFTITERKTSDVDDEFVVLCVKKGSEGSYWLLPKKLIDFTIEAEETTLSSGEFGYRFYLK